MNKEEYASLVTAATKAYKTRLYDIDKEYAFSNNIVKVGDVITDHYHIIKVEKMEMTKVYGHSIPELLYSGTQYTKGGKPAKRQVETAMYQNNILLINDIPIETAKKNAKQ